MGHEEIFPRELTELERALLLWVLPIDRSGYAEYRRLVEGWKVVGKGRRGEGNYILAEPGQTLDIESPLPQALAYGFVKSAEGGVTISVRERFGDQLEFEITGPASDIVFQGLESCHRWTFSEWLPSRTCPACDGPVRKVEMKTGSGRSLILAFCVTDRRLWVYDQQTGINHLMPVMGYYNELMLQKRVQDPKIALNSKRLFTDLDTYGDSALTRAFSSYNRMRTKVLLGESLVVPTEETVNWFTRAARWLLKGRKQRPRWS
ncbi:MAG: hypothetical protein Q8P51_03765 [Ignavibacteria bacterium]|nr:hypothetical protein [Ignavibacteria bacterium]